MDDETIPNQDLKLEDIPQEASDWREVVRFARTLDGYKEAGSLKKAGLLANERKSERCGVGGDWTLTELRICLFFEYRRFNHVGHPPEIDDLNYLHSLVAEIRKRVDAKEIA
jgi:hypothetical protein